MSSPEKIVILNYIDKKVLILDYDSNSFHNIEDFFLSEKFENTNISINNCEYMVVTSDELSISFDL